MHLWPQLLRLISCFPQGRPLSGHHFTSMKLKWRLRYPSTSKFTPRKCIWPHGWNTLIVWWSDSHLDDSKSINVFHQRSKGFVVMSFNFCVNFELFFDNITYTQRYNLIRVYWTLLYWPLLDPCFNFAIISTDREIMYFAI